MAALTVTSEQSAVINAADGPMDAAFGEGIVGTSTIPPYDKYTTLHSTMKGLVKNAYKSFLGAVLEGMKVATPQYVNVSTYGTGWSAWGDVTYSAGVVRLHKDAMGYVKIEGIARAPASPAANTTIFTLPTGFRPGSGDSQLFIGVHNDLPCTIEVSSSGAVIFRGTPVANTWVSINARYKPGG